MNPLDTIPTKPVISTSREIRTTVKFSACLTRAGLIVQRHSTGTGKRMASDHTQFKDWLDALDNALDDEEFDTLCRHFA